MLNNVKSRSSFRGPPHILIKKHIFVNTMVHNSQYIVNISTRFLSNSEADASKLPENLVEIFPRYLY